MPRPGDRAPRAITQLPGDGIGPLITSIVEQVMEVMHTSIYFERYEIHGDMTKKRKSEKLEARPSISGARVRAPKDKLSDPNSKARTRRLQSVSKITLSKPTERAALIPRITEIVSASSASTALDEACPAPIIKEL
ncbi:hypothetical protein GIB67_021561 [Kingdonia uniflora]|uniref:Isocitrate dehydrogenase n=1 Tax=Kingdonia uniflora TaxID=39325 RepID=A0A7J7L9M4_9MAGN|nr:hypothetical protein GIB67_021561 [Kingdonia uniflora]